MNRVLEVQTPTEAVVMDQKIIRRVRQYQSKHYTASKHNIGFRSTLNSYSKIYDHDLRY